MHRPRHRRVQGGSARSSCESIQRWYRRRAEDLRRARRSKESRKSIEVAEQGRRRRAHGYDIPKTRANGSPVPCGRVTRKPWGGNTIDHRFVRRVNAHICTPTSNVARTLLIIERLELEGKDTRRRVS